MRLIGNENHEQQWRSQVTSLGPFCLLLWDHPSNSESAKAGIILYRGAPLPQTLIQMFQNDCLTDPKPIHSFQSFTSCSRNRDVAHVWKCFISNDSSCCFYC